MNTVLCAAEALPYNSDYHAEIRLHPLKEIGMEGYVPYREYAATAHDRLGITVPDLHTIGPNSEYIAYRSEFHNGTADNGVLLHIYKPAGERLIHIFSLEELFRTGTDSYYERQPIAFDGESISFRLKEIANGEEQILAECCYSIQEKNFSLIDRVGDSQQRIPLYFADSNPDKLFAEDIAIQSLPDGSIVICPLEDGRFDGFGFQIWDEKHFYKGSFSHGMYEGEGWLCTADYTYIGEFSNGAMAGLGLMQLADGTKLSGTFKDGRLLEAQTRAAEAYNLKSEESQTSVGIAAFILALLAFLGVAMTIRLWRAVCK